LHLILIIFSYVKLYIIFLERDERDLVVLRHEVGIRWPDGRREERGINFVVYGQPQGHSAMAMTVGKPAAIAAKMILDGGFPYYSSL